MTVVADLPGPFRAAAFLLVSLAATTVFQGCEGSKPDGGATPKGNVVLRDENNYTSQSALTLPVVQTASGADLDICWGAPTKDILCHDLAPATDIDNISFLQIAGLTKAQIEAKLAAGQLAPSEVKIYRDFHVDHAAASTCAKLSSLSLGGVPVAPAQDYVEASDKKHMLLFSRGIIPGSGARTMLFVEPTAASTNTAVMAPDGCGILTFTADLTAPQPLKIPAAGPWVVDWSLITHDSMNGPVIFQYIDSLLVAFYQGMTTADLQMRFLDIEQIATALYEVPIPTGARSADLAAAKDGNGVTFPGFGRSDGVWAVGLLCSTCQVPAPVAMAILQPTATPGQ